MEERQRQIDLSCEEWKKAETAKEKEDVLARRKARKEQEALAEKKLVEDRRTSMAIHR